jgi:LacI family transcriptional regulator
MSDDRTSSRRRHARIKLTDVAAAAGVHVSTVSRVLRDDRSGRVSPTVAERIRSTAQALGYTAHPLAAGMRTQSTLSVGVIVHDISDPVYPPILGGIERRMGAAGYMVVLGNTGYAPAAELAMLDQMAARMMDGVILCTTRREDPVVERALAMDIPLVSVLRRTDAGLCSAVVNDCAMGMHALTQAVLDRGHRDIATIGAPQDLSTACERHAAVCETLRANGVALPDDRIAFVPQMNVEEGRRAMLDLLARRGAPPSAVIAVNDLVAIGAMQACRTAGLNCPSDISITGYNGIPLMDMIDPPLTTVAMDLPGIGMQAADLLLEHLGNPQMAVRVDVIAPVLRLRESLGPLTAR